MRENSMMDITRHSVITGIARARNIAIKPDDMKLYRTGSVSLSDAMPYLSSQDREFILAGITPTEWDNLFSSELQEIVNDKMGS